MRRITTRIISRFGGLILALACAALAFGQGSPLPITPYQVNDTRNGTTKPCSGCYIYTYAAGTTTPLATYTDSTLGTTLPNPVRTNSAGFAVNGSNAITGVWTGYSCYKIVLKDPGAVTLWTQDHVCSPSQISSNILALLAASSGSSLVGFIQSGIGATAETVQAKLRQVLDAQDFGVKCDGGATNSTTALQAAIDATASGVLNICGPNLPSAGVASPGLFLYPANAGITINGFRYPNVNISYSAGTGGGLVAISPAPDTILTDLSGATSHINNLLLDSATLAAHGLVDVSAARATRDNVIVAHSTGSGYVLWNEGSPTTTLTSAVSSGAVNPAIAVAGLTNNRITFKKDWCSAIELDYGTANYEAFTISAISPTSGIGAGTVTISGTLAHNHAIGSTARCHGNNNEERVTGYKGYQNGGWGFEIISGTDNNGIHWFDGESDGNTSGGEKWIGAVNMHYGGNYQSDTGPAIQLGDTSGGQTGGMYISPFGDGEEPVDINGQVWSVCDSASRVDAQAVHQPNGSTGRLVIWKGAQACPSFSLGSTTTGIIGVQDQNGSASLFIQGANGIVPIGVNRQTVTSGGRCTYPGELNMNPNGTNKLTTMQQCIGGTAASVTNTTNANPAVLTTAAAPTNGTVYIAGYTNACQVLNGSWTGTNISGTTFSIPINSTSLGACTGSPTVSTPKWTSSTATDITGALVLSAGPNNVTSTGGSDVDLVVTLNDSFGNAVPLVDGQVLNISLPAGLQATTSIDLAYNGLTAAVIRSRYSGSAIATAYSAGAVITVRYSSGANQWKDQSQ